jgi:N-acetylneuraminic acid mutarotase
MVLYNIKYDSLSSHITFIKIKEEKMKLYMRKFLKSPPLGILTVFGILCITSISLAQDSTWTTKASMLTERFAHSTSMVNGKIYVIGGVKDAKSLTFLGVEEYDPVTDTWTTKADMQIPRYWFGVCTVNDKIYAIGGTRDVHGPGYYFVEEYDPVADTWTRKADMPTARAILTASVVNGKIYAIGGTTNRGEPTLATVEEYDPATDVWTGKTNMNTPRWGHSTCVANGKIYAIGGTAASGDGWPGLASVEEYDPATDTWTTKTDMPDRRAYHSASVVNGKIYVIGGGRDLNTSGISAVEAYDPVSDTWTTKTDMPTKRFFLSTSTVYDKIYAIGGSVKNQFYSLPWLGCSTVEAYDPALDQATSVGNSSSAQNPSEFLLYQNYPNPFNPATAITYDLFRPGLINLSVYDLTGRRVNTLISQHQNSGHYQVRWDGTAFPNGIYLIRLTEGAYSVTQKMTLHK